MPARNSILDRVGILIALTVVVRMAFIAIMPSTWSFDVEAWMEVVRVMRSGDNPYAHTDLLHYAPLWPAILRALDLISMSTALPFVHCVQGFLIGVDVLTVLLVRQLLERSGAWVVGGRALLLGLVLNPISILLAVQHGNFDALVAVWLLLCIASLWRYHASGASRDWLLACLFLGLGVLTKTAPLLFAPMLLPGHRHRSLVHNAIGALLLLGPFVLSLLPLWIADESSVMKHVIGYRSFPGWFGITGLLRLAGLHDAMMLMARAGSLVIIALMAAASWRIRGAARLDPRSSLKLALWLVFGLIVLGPGYSPQYIAWFLPLLIVHSALSHARERRFIAVVYAVAALTYLVEYALIQDHGAFLLHWSSSHAVAHWSEVLKAPGPQTMLRLPLFLCYGFLLLRLSRPWPLMARAVARS